MQVQVNSNHIPGSVELHEWVGTTVEDRLERFDDFLTRVEVHVSDENAQKAGADDKRCQIEARPKGHQAVSVTHKAESLQLAVDGAADKMQHALEHLMGKLDTRVLSRMRCSKRNSWKSRTSSTSDPVAPAAGRGVSTRFILFLSPCCRACVLAAGPVYPVARCRSSSCGTVDPTTAQRAGARRLA